MQATLDSLRARLERHALSRVLTRTVEGYLEDRLPNQAAAMTYFGVFSLFPLVLLFIALTGLVLQNNDTARAQILGAIADLLPQGQDELARLIAGVIAAKGTAAGIGLLTLLWSALGWFQVVDDNVNAIWGVTQSRAVVQGKLFALAMVAAIGGIALASFAATAVIGLLAQFTDLVPGSGPFWQAVVSLFSGLTIATAFALLYRYTPRCEVRWADVWPAAVATALAWEATRRLLAIYFEHTDMISGYGPIGAVMALMFWLYVASTIVLIGAELSHAIAAERRHVPPETAASPTRA